MADDYNALALVDPVAVFLGPGTIPYAVGIGSDANDLPFLPRMMHVSVAGNMKYTAGGVTVALEAFEIGWHPCRMSRIWATGLTATVTVWR